MQTHSANVQKLVPIFDYFKNHSWYTSKRPCTKLNQKNQQALNIVIDSFKTIRKRKSWLTNLHVPPLPLSGHGFRPKKLVHWTFINQEWKVRSPFFKEFAHDRHRKTTKTVICFIEEESREKLILFSDSSDQPLNALQKCILTLKESKEFWRNYSQH